jgi:hypothetical protein
MKALALSTVAVLALICNAQAQIGPALLQRDASPLRGMIGKSADIEFARLVAQDTIGVCKALDVSFSDDGARAFESYLLSSAMRRNVASPEGEKLPAEAKAKNRHKFILLLVTEAETKPEGRFITATSFRETLNSIQRLRDWFCPCFPFCQ